MKKKGSGSRFPVARIKKIMQADDDVGKVAQGTPVLVSKAVEMFLESLVAGAAAQATYRGSKKVQSYHLKQAVYANDDFDFLKDLVVSIPDPVCDDVGDQNDEEAGKGKERASGKGRKPKGITSAGPGAGGTAPRDYVPHAAAVMGAPGMGGGYGVQDAGLGRYPSSYYPPSGTMPLHPHAQASPPQPTMGYNGCNDEEDEDEDDYY